jgi:hypothetical protein
LGIIGSLMLRVAGCGLWVNLELTLRLMFLLVKLVMGVCSYSAY